jgi:hypothetical protein
MNEKMLRTMIDAAAVKRARIIANGSRFHIEVDAPGRSFAIETGKGAVRTWSSIDSAARWLRGLGIGHIALELTHWQPGQKSLLA